MIKRTLALAFSTALLVAAWTVPAHAAAGSFDVPIADPTSGCQRHVVVAYDTTKSPPAWSNGYVVCD